MGLIFSAMVIASVYQHKVRKPYGPFVFISIKSRFCPPQNRTFLSFSSRTNDRNLFLVRNIEVWDPKFHILQTNECFYEGLLKEHCRCTFLPRVILMNVRTFSPPVSSLGSSIALPNVILSLSSKHDINQTISKQ